VERPLGERASYLDVACSDDPELRREVEELLAAHEEGLPLLDRSLPVGVGGVASEEETQLWRGAPLRPGTVLAERFVILERIGAGGMGEVYAAEDRELGRPVALKTLLAGQARSPSSLARFRKEIHLAQQVTHRNVCRVFDLARHGDLVFLTMELLEGETLAQRLERQGRLSLAESWTILEQVVAALEASHDVGVIHRDLKPSNVFLVEESSGLRAVVTDFGLATSGDLATAKDAHLTNPGELVGTPAYMAPEQLEGRQVGSATDVYALGLLLYEMVTAERPFGDGSAFSVARRRLENDATSPRKHLPDLSEHWERVILRCLARHPADRFQRPREVTAALRPPPDALAAPPGKRRSLPWLWVAAGLLAAAITGLFLWSQGGLSRSREPVGIGRTEPRAQGTETLAFEEQDAVLLTDFENHTGDPALDGLLEAVLANELSASRFLTVASRARIGDALRLMRRPADAPLDGALGREVALRDPGIRAIIEGRIDRIGSALLITARLIAPDDGSVLASWSENAEQTDSTLRDALERIGRGVREHLGERSEPPASRAEIEKVTTPSLRALRLYQEAEAVITRYGMDATSEELLREAIREDPEFASAHLLLAFALQNQGRGLDEYLPHAERAMELADTVPDRERYFIRGSYFVFTGDAERGRASYEALLRLHPDHYWANNNMAVLLWPTAGIPYHVRKARYRPNDLDANWDAAHALAIVGGRMDEAQLFIDRVIELAKIDIPPRQEHEAVWARQWQFHRHWLAGDLDGAQAELDRRAAELPGQPGPLAWWTRKLLVRGYRTLGLARQATELMPLPEYRQQRRFFQGLEAFFQDDLRGISGGFGGDGWGDRWWGDLLLEDPVRVAGLARHGRIDEARIVLEGFRGHRRVPTPDSTEPPEVLESLMAAELALAQGQADQAASSLENLLEHDWEHYGATFFLATQSLADAYRRLGRDTDAVAVLERSEGERRRSYPWGAELWMATQLRRARLHRELGDTEAADRLESELGDLMRLADPDFWLRRELERSR
jgi:tetratricopeptide (TPR) repeat protein